MYRNEKIIIKSLIFRAQLLQLMNIVHLWNYNNLIHVDFITIMCGIVYQLREQAVVSVEAQIPPLLFSNHVTLYRLPNLLCLIWKMMIKWYILQRFILRIKDFKASIILSFEKYCSISYVPNYYYPLNVSVFIPARMPLSKALLGVAYKTIQYLNYLQ